jgi:hypothetical protein
VFVFTKGKKKIFNKENLKACECVRMGFFDILPGAARRAQRLGFCSSLTYFQVLNRGNKTASTEGSGWEAKRESEIVRGEVWDETEEVQAIDPFGGSGFLQPLALLPRAP